MSLRWFEGCETQSNESWVAVPRVFPEGGKSSREALMRQLKGRRGVGAVLEQVKKQIRMFL